MPATSGASHGLAAFASLLIGSVLSKFVWDLVPPVGELSVLAIGVVQSQTAVDLPVTERFAGALVVMVGLSFAWGVVYHLGRHA